MNKRKLINTLLIATENIIWVLYNNEDLDITTWIVLKTKAETYLDLVKGLHEGVL